MVLDANKYRVNIPYIKSFLLNKSHSEIISLIGTLALATGVPIVVLYHYVAEIYGYFPQLVDQLTKVKKFYGIKKVLNTKGDDV